MASRRLSVALSTCAMMLLWGTGAAAQTFSTPVVSFYADQEVDYTVGNAQAFVDGTVDFGPAVQMLSIVAVRTSTMDEVVVYDPTDGSACTDVGMMCDLPIAGAYIHRVTVAANGFTVQPISSPGPGSFWPYLYRVRVRIDGPCPNTDPQVVFSPGGTFDSPVCAGFGTLNGVTLSPPLVSLTRRAPPLMATANWDAQVSTGTADIFSPMIPTCAPAQACAIGDPGQLVSLDTSESNPATLGVVALNTPDPPSGNQTIDLSVDHAGLSFPNATQLVIEESAVDALGVDTVPGGQTAVAADTPLTVRVVSAVNQNGGFEPRTASRWEVIAAPAPPGGTASWLSISDAQTAVLTVPSGELGFLGPTDSLNLTVRAFHTNPDASETMGEVSLSLDGAGLADCSISANATDVSLGGSVSLVAQTRDSMGTVMEAGFAPTWTASAGSLTVEPGMPQRATLVAPEQPGTVTVRAEFPPGLCNQSEATLNIEVVPGLRVRLDVDDAAVAPGAVSRVRAEVANFLGQEISDLRLRFQVGRGIETLGRLPRGEGGLEIRESTAPVSVPLTANGVPASDPWFSVSVPAGAVPVSFSVPFLARVSASCRDVPVVLEAVDPSDGSVLASERTQITIGCDPELTESTLFGKVFADHDGDGEQDPGERGIPGAMVALATGIYAVTDDNGMYHIARLQPRRHAVKINVHTLPPGAELTTDEVHVLTLTPGVFRKVSFGVRVPRVERGERGVSFMPSGSGLVLTDDGPRYRMRLAGPQDVRVSAWQDGFEVEGKWMNGGWELYLPVEGKAYWSLVERGELGQLWISTMAVFRYGRADRGELVVPWGPYPVAELLLPPEDRPQKSASLVVSGTVHGASEVGVELGAQRCELGGKVGSEPSTVWDVRCELPIRRATQRLTVSVNAAGYEAGNDPPEERVPLPVQMDNTVHFFVGLLSGEVGRLVGQDAAAGESPLTWDARGAFFYRGMIQGKYLVTAGADVDRDVFFKRSGSLRRFAGMSRRVFGHDPQRVFRDLDPEAYYPVYGDSSGTVDERETGGRFFVRLEVDRSFVKWGAINTSVDDVEVGRYVRSLYGLGAHLEGGTEETTVSGRAELFGAQPQTVPALDELTVTGGSLYFLSHGGVVEGTLRITWETLDEISGLPIRAVALTEGVDYEADYLGGRVTLDPILPYRTLGASLTAPASGGARNRLLVEYEYVPSVDGSRDVVMGARLVGRAGPVSLGVTGVTQLAETEAEAVRFQDPLYGLLGASARVDLGEPLRLRAEFAHSTGGSHVAAKSSDGGLRFDQRDVVGDRSGNAAALEVSSAGGSDSAQVSARAYGRLFQRDFNDSHRAAGTRTLQGGVRLDADFASGERAKTGVAVQWDYRQNRPEGLELDVRNLSILGLTQKVGGLSVGVEGRHRYAPRTQEQRAAVAGLVSYQFGDGWQLTLRRRQLLVDDIGDGAGTSASAAAGKDSDTSLGLGFQRKSWSIAGEAGMDDAADPFGRVQGSAPVTEDTQLYLGYARTARLAESQLYGDGVTTTSRSRVVAGGRRTVADGVALYAENAFRMDGSERGGSRVVGGDVPLGDQTRLTFTYERAEVDPDDRALQGKTRDAASIGASFASPRFNGRILADGRRDRDGTDVAAWGLQGRGEFKASEDLTLALAMRGSSSYLITGGSAGADVLRHGWETSLGFALRPVSWDALSVFGRYAVVLEREGAAASTEPQKRQSHIVALALVYDVAKFMSLSPKVAYRLTQVELPDASAADDAFVSAVRGDVHVGERWDVGVEGRVCASPSSGEIPTQAGALAELSIRLMTWLRLGAGYNFSEIATTGVQCREPGARGVFVRAEAVY